MSTLLLADLHLPAQDSPLREAFLAFLRGPATGAQRLYILGDLFEYWIGDDVGRRVYAAECAALAELVASGVAVGVMHGNRDFLLGAGFADASGVRLVDDPLVTAIAGRRVLLSHGDRWCTDDRAYQRWRRFARNRVAQRLFLRLPVRLRQRIAGDLRRSSGRDKSVKPVEIMDVHPEAVADAFRRHGVDWIIHGHTHRPADHLLTVDGRRCRRTVLPDWRPDRMQWLEVDEDGERLRGL